jgi:hypothetical protein
MQITRCLDAGMSILVASVSPQNIPSCCRAIALTADEQVSSVTVYVPMAPSHETIHNVALTRRLAIAVSHPIDHCTIQLKGTTATARLARDDEKPFVKARLDAFADILDSIGIPATTTKNAAYWPAFAIEMRVEQVFEQTPGPNAGKRVR